MSAGDKKRLPDRMPQPKPPRALQVFLCHSSGDKQAVRRLYDRLHADGIDPWLDEKKLIPGQDWRAEIEKAVRASDAVIVCLSGSSITKEGFVQREIKIALDAAKEKPEGTIYIIPARLEDCEVPESLRQWHWVDLFHAAGHDGLMQALQLRADSLGMSFKGGTRADRGQASEALILQALQHPDFVWRTAREVATYAGLKQQEVLGALQQMAEQGHVIFESSCELGDFVALSSRAQTSSPDVDKNQAGFIAHGGQGYWFTGPLPSPRCARLLVRLHGGIERDPIPPDIRERLQRKWILQPDYGRLIKVYPSREQRVKWAVRLESPSAESPAVMEQLGLIQSLNVPVLQDTGPYFPETPVESWQGESC